jgi:hypothetical protein
LSGFPKGEILSVLPKAEDLSIFPKAEGVSDFQVWDIGQVTVSNFDWLPFTPPLVAFSGPSGTVLTLCSSRLTLGGGTTSMQRCSDEGGVVPTVRRVAPRVGGWSWACS